jgi:glycosyltransferase involved in cell wall biosynthesis
MATRVDHEALAASKGPELQTRSGLFSVVTPAHNEAENLPALFERLRHVLDPLGLEWEWVIVDDHSSDATFSVAADLARRDPRVRCLRFSRNFGSHVAITCGLEHASGRCVVVMAADLQDPPETLPALLEQWRRGAQVVWAARDRREGEEAGTVAFSRLYYLLMRRVVGIPEMPATGADFFLIDRAIVKALQGFNERNSSLFALITWMGFRQATILCAKEPRVRGRSSWTLKKKLKLFADSITSFTYLPIRLMSYAGIVTALAGFAYAAFIFTHALAGRQVQGWSSLMVVVLVASGFQMLMMGVLGEYLWRALDESRRRPRYLIEAEVGGVAQVASGPRRDEAKLE